MNEFVNNLEPCPTLSEYCKYVCHHMNNNVESCNFALFKDPSDKYLKFYLVHS